MTHPRLAVVRLVWWVGLMGLVAHARAKRRRKTTASARVGLRGRLMDDLGSRSEPRYKMLAKRS